MADEELVTAAMVPAVLGAVKTPFIERWERDIEDYIGAHSAAQDAYIKGWAGDADAELLAPHSTVVIPPSGYTDFIKEGLKEAGLLSGSSQSNYEVASGKALPAAVEPPPESARKELHNATEKRRREKINGKLGELRDAIPISGAAGANKTTVLRATVEHIRALNAQYVQLQTMNRSLQETNSHLLNELREMHRLLWSRARETLQPPRGGALPPNMPQFPMQPMYPQPPGVPTHVQIGHFQEQQQAQHMQQIHQSMGMEMGAIHPIMAARLPPNPRSHQLPPPTPTPQAPQQQLPAAAAPRKRRGDDAPALQSRSIKASASSSPQVQLPAAAEPPPNPPPEGDSDEIY